LAGPSVPRERKRDPPYQRFGWNKGQLKPVNASGSTSAIWIRRRAKRHECPAFLRSDSPSTERPSHEVARRRCGSQPLELCRVTKHGRRVPRIVTSSAKVPARWLQPGDSIGLR